MDRLLFPEQYNIFLFIKSLTNLGEGEEKATNDLISKNIVARSLKLISSSQMCGKYLMKLFSSLCWKPDTLLIIQTNEWMF